MRELISGSRSDLLGRLRVVTLLSLLTCMSYFLMSCKKCDSQLTAEDRTLLAYDMASEAVFVNSGGGATTFSVSEPAESTREGGYGIVSSGCFSERVVYLESRDETHLLEFVLYHDDSNPDPDLIFYYNDVPTNHFLSDGLIETSTDVGGTSVDAYEVEINTGGFGMNYMLYSMELGMVEYGETIEGVDSTVVWKLDL